MAKCDECGREFKTVEAMRQHALAKHPAEESFASRAINAQLDQAMGFPTDDDWLNP